MAHCGYEPTAVLATMGSLKEGLRAMREQGAEPQGLTGLPVLRRTAARVMLSDRRGRVLLFRGGDPARPEAGTWWFTPGGGTEPGETLVAAAAREVAEEAGIALAESALVGPVWRRSTSFAFDGVLIEQEEHFFRARVDLDGDDVAADRSRWTELEHRSVVEQRWWELPALRETSDTVHPPGLADLVEHPGHPENPRTV